MATIREHFETDPRIMTVHDDLTLTSPGNQASSNVTVKLHLDSEANARYWSFFIPAGVDVAPAMIALLNHPATRAYRLDKVAVDYALGFDGYMVSTTTLLPTHRVLVYVDADLPVPQRDTLVTLARGLGYEAVVRDRGYAAIITAHATPLAFISHDSSDKDSLVRELAQKMTALSCPVWYDEYSLKVGDNLRESIERGLKESHRCILVLSPAFLANKGWGKAEYDSIFTRELLEKKDVILPVWHNVDVAEVYEYSPRLANKMALKSSLGIDELALRLSNVVRTAAGLG